MPSEREWVNGMIETISAGLRSRLGDEPAIEVIDQLRLPYTNEIEGYVGTEPIQQSRAGYATDLIVRDIENESWVPRVVVEAKLGAVTTHDALTYSAKACTHKNVHPYLRYGILIGNWGDYALPARLFRHGAFFDFMMTLRGIEPTAEEADEFCEVLALEVVASRQIQALLAKSRQNAKPTYHLVHRPLNLR